MPSHRAWCPGFGWPSMLILEFECRFEWKQIVGELNQFEYRNNKSVCKTNQCLLVEFTTLVEFTKQNIFFSSRHFSFLTTNNNFSTFWCWCFQPQFVSKKVENLRICGPVFEFFWQKKKFFGEKNSFWRCWSLSSWFWFYDNHWQIFCFFRKQKAAKRLQNRQKLFFRQIPFFLPKKSKKRSVNP